MVSNYVIFSISEPFGHVHFGLKTAKSFKNLIQFQMDRSQPLVRVSLLPSSPVTQGTMSLSSSVLTELKKQSGKFQCANVAFRIDRTNEVNSEKQNICFLCPLQNFKCQLLSYQ